MPDFRHAARRCVETSPCCCCWPQDRVQCTKQRFKPTIAPTHPAFTQGQKGAAAGRAALADWTDLARCIHLAPDPHRLHRCSSSSSTSSRLVRDCRPVARRSSLCRWRGFSLWLCCSSDRCESSSLSTRPSTLALKIHCTAHIKHPLAHPLLPFQSSPSRAWHGLVGLMSESPPRHRLLSYPHTHPLCSAPASCCSHDLRAGPPAYSAHRQPALPLTE